VRQPPEKNKGEMSQAFSHGQLRMRLSGRVKAALIIAAETISNSGNDSEVGVEAEACICWEGYRLYSSPSTSRFAQISSSRCLQLCKAA
jgi:hypothetical protein